MTPASLISELAARGVELQAYGDNVRFRPAEKLTADEVDVIRRHKAVILKLLRPESGHITNGHKGGEHFSLWLHDPDSPWPEFIPGYHYDIRQPSRLLPLCSSPGVARVQKRKPKTPLPQTCTFFGNIQRGGYRPCRAKEVEE
jgi:hypothetical protein